jgi:hypothetical protein
VHPFPHRPVFFGEKDLYQPKPMPGRVKKLSAILLFSLFAFSQYARQLNWLECKFSNEFKTESSKCDCEKQAGFDKPGDDPSPVSKTHTHIHLDEFFAGVKELVIDPCLSITEPGFNRLHNSDELEGKYRKPWQPPNS